MSTPPIRIPITADDQYSAALSTAQARVRSFGAESGLAGESMRHSFNEAKSAAALLGEETGVHLNRHLRSVLAGSQLLGPVLKAAFPIAAALGFIEIAERIPEAIDKATSALAGYGEVARKQYEDDLRANEAALLHFKTLAQGYATLQQLRQQSDDLNKKQESARDPFAGIGDAFQESGPAGVGAKIVSNMLAFKDATASAVKENAEVQKVLERINELQVERNKKEEEYAKKVEATAKRLDELRFKVRQEITKSSPSRSSISGNHIDTFTDLLAMQAEPNQEIAAKYLKHFQDLQAVFAETRRPAELLAISIQNLNQLFRGDTTSETYKRALENIKDRYDEARQAAEKFGQEVGHALAEGILMGRSWKNVLDSLIVAIAQLIVKMYVLKALQASSFGSSGFGGFITALVGGFSGKAGGGSVSAGTPYLVGENGPEVFMPNTGGSIVPNGKWGGGQTIYNIDARGAEIGVEQKILAAMKATHQRAVADSVEIIRQNGFRGRN